MFIENNVHGTSSRHIDHTNFSSKGKKGENVCDVQLQRTIATIAESQL